jgi:hypothetical protein
MPAPDQIAENFKDRVRLQLGADRFLTRAQEKALLLEAIDCDIALDEARRLIEAVAGGRKARLETEVDTVMHALMTTLAGGRGWISRTKFETAAAACQRLSQGKIGDREAKMRVKRMMIENGWQVRGAIVFGQPKWFRDVAGD